MERLSVNLTAPDLVKQIRLLHQQGNGSKPPFHKVEERSGTGKATCRSCGEPIGEGDKTIFYEHGDDEAKPWLRTRGTIHADDCGDFSGDWVKCPKCPGNKQVQNEAWSQHWRDHRYQKAAELLKRATSGEMLEWLVRGFHYVPMTKEAASGTREDKERRDALVAEIPEHQLPSVHDEGSAALSLPDGYSIRHLKTLGDARFEGEMMSHCLGNPQVHQMFRGHYGMDEDDWGGDFKFPPPPPEHVIREHYPDATPEMIEHISSRGESRLMSLRDHNGIPRATWWEPKDSAQGTEIREIGGFANSHVKSKYEHRIRQYHRKSLEDAGLTEGKFEHIGNVKEDAQDETGMQYAPIQNLHVHDLPSVDDEYEGQQYSDEMVRTAHCGICPEDRHVAAPVTPIGIDVPVPGKGPNSLKNKWMDKLLPDRKVDIKLPKDQPVKSLEGDDPFVEKFDSDEDFKLGHTGDVEPHDVPQNADALRQHMQDHHFMESHEVDLPDAALGAVHDSDHEGPGFGHKHENPLADIDWSPEAQRDLSEMKGKDLANQLWDAVGGNEPRPVHCPECGSHDTKKLRDDVDEDGFAYEAMKCHGCGHDFAGDEAGSGLNFTQDEPQQWFDSWRNKDRTAEFKGSCMNCGKRTYSFTDGENDPRGPLGDHSASPLTASDYELEGPDVPLCFNCANDYDSYKVAQDYAEKIWKQSAARGLDQTAKPGNSTSMGDYDQDQSAEMTNGYEPRVDQAGQAAREKAMKKQVDDEARKLQRGMKGLDQFAGWKHHGGD